MGRYGAVVRGVLFCERLGAERKGFGVVSGGLGVLSWHVGVLSCDLRAVFRRLRAVSGRLRGLSGRLRLVSWRLRLVSGRLRVTSCHVRLILCQVRVVSGRLRVFSGALGVVSRPVAVDFQRLRGVFLGGTAEAGARAMVLRAVCEGDNDWPLHGRPQFVSISMAPRGCRHDALVPYQSLWTIGIVPPQMAPSVRSDGSTTLPRLTTTCPMLSLYRHSGAVFTAPTSNRTTRLTVDKMGGNVLHEEPENATSFTDSHASIFPSALDRESR